MNMTKIWINHTIGRIGMHLVLKYAQRMDKELGGLPRGPMDAIAHLLTRQLDLESCAIVRVQKGDWCKCGKGPNHRQALINLNSFGMTDEEMASHMTHIAAGLEGSLMVARHEQYGTTPQYDA
jgi:hypothetical protein